MGLPDNEIDHYLKEGGEESRCCTEDYVTQVLKCEFKLYKAFGNRMLYCFSEFPHVVIEGTLEMEPQLRDIPTHRRK